jgi:GNAT superfamily N-acetyltransferase
MYSLIIEAPGRFHIHEVGEQRCAPPALSREDTMIGTLDLLAPEQPNATLVLDDELGWLPRLGEFRVRPLLATDRAAYDSFDARLDLGDLRLRFAAPTRLDSPVLDALFRLMDHDSLEAFAAFNARGEILGIAHIARTAQATAEIALIVRSDLKGRGLGQLLLDRLVRHAEVLGLAELTAQVLYENRPMLGLATQAGFHIAGSSGVMADLRKVLRLPAARA